MLSALSICVYRDFLSSVFVSVVAVDCFVVFVCFLGGGGGSGGWLFFYDALKRNFVLSKILCKAVLFCFPFSTYQKNKNKTKTNKTKPKTKQQKTHYASTHSLDCGRL